MFGGVDDALESFIERGYWYCWNKKVPTGEESKGPNSIERQIEKFKEISIGDKIAVKKIRKFIVYLNKKWKLERWVL